MPSSFAEPVTNQKNQLLLWISLFSGATLLSLGLIMLVFIINSLQGIFPDQTTLGGIDVSLLSPDAAKVKIEEQLKPNQNFQINLISQDEVFSTDSASLGYKYLVDESVNTAFAISHSQLTLTKPIELVKALLNKKDFPLQRIYNQVELQNFITQTAQEVDIVGHDPFAKVGDDLSVKSLSVDRGKVGQELNQEALLKQLETTLQTKTNTSQVDVTIIPESKHLELSETELEAAKELATKYLKTTIVFDSELYKDVRQEIKPQQIVSLLAFPTGINRALLDNLVNQIGEKINRPSRDAIFKYEKNDQGKPKVLEFQPHQDGLSINKVDISNKIIESIDKIANFESETALEQINHELIMETVQPTLTLDKLNDLGIKELVGFGDSYYAHSIPNRVWNVALTTKKIDLTLIPPGTEFSFNKNLGEVSRSTGYRSAYVISGGKTVLGDGGGVCQVSTTLFRAALDAGLKITKRKAHAYRVSYYELNQKPGIDATVYSGDVDLRFINDTPGYLLMKTEADSENLYMKIELYGTSDGRSAEITNHKTWDLRGPPASAYYPTTDLPKGVTKQIDWAVSGIKASFDYIVKDKNGQIIHQENYYSNYAPWSAKYLQGV